MYLYQSVDMKHFNIFSGMLLSTALQVVVQYEKLLADSGIDFDVSTLGHYIAFFKGHMVCLSRIVIYVDPADSQFV
jgi:hypothetical protein